MTTTITRADLAESVYEHIGLSRKESEGLVESVLDGISDALVREGQAKISSFGSFIVKQKKARVGRNPKSGVEVMIEPRKVVSFKPSHILKDKMNK